MHQRKNQIEYNLFRFQQQPSMNNQFKSVEGGFIYKENDKKYVPKAITKESFDSQPGASKPKDIVGSIKHFFVTLFWFCYPYTMVGRVSSSFSIITLINKFNSFLRNKIFWIIINVLNVLNVSILPFIRH